MAAIDRKQIGNNLYLSSNKYSNVISTSKPMFSGSDNTIIQLRKLPDVWTNEEIKMASVDRKLMYPIYIFDYSQIHTSSSLRNSLVLLPDPINMGIAVGISSLSSIEAEILRYSICTSGIGGHL